MAQEVRRALVRDGYGPTDSAWAEALAAHCNRREQSRVQQLVEQAYAYDDRQTLRTVDFVERIRTQRMADPCPPPSG